MNLNQRGLATYKIVLLIAALILIGSAVTLIIMHDTKKTATTTMATPQPSNVTGPSQAAATLKVPELGIQIPLTDDLVGLNYSYDAALPSAGFSTSSLATLDASCNADSSALGSLVKMPRENAYSMSVVYDLGDGSVIEYQAPQGYCTDAMDNISRIEPLLTKQTQAFAAAFKKAEKIR